MGQLLVSTLIYIDINRITQVIRNLLSNAFKFTPKGGKVTVTASPAFTGQITVVPAAADVPLA
jgi:signal transduction histidine kinase